MCRHLEFLKTQREILFGSFFNQGQKVMKFIISRLGLNRKPQLPTFEPRVEICSHMRRNTFHCCSGLRRSSPSPALQRRWTYSCDLIRWFPLATRRHKAKQGETLLLIGRFLRHYNGSCNYCTWCFSPLTISEVSGGCGRREILTWWKRRQDGPGGDGFCHHWRQKINEYSTEGTQVFSACFVFCGSFLLIKID